MDPVSRKLFAQCPGQIMEPAVMSVSLGPCELEYMVLRVKSTKFRNVEHNVGDSFHGQSVDQRFGGGTRLDPLR